MRSIILKFKSPFLIGMVVFVVCVILAGIVYTSLSVIYFLIKINRVIKLEKGLKERQIEQQNTYKTNEIVIDYEEKYEYID